MTHDEFNEYCRSFVATTYVMQWGGADVWKVGGKVFAIAFTQDSGAPAFTFKTSPLNFEFLSDCEGYRPAPYFANRGMKWIQQTDTSGSLDEDAKYYISESYRLVAAGLSKKKRLELGIDLDS